MKIYEDGNAMVSLDESTGTLLNVARYIKPSDDESINVPITNEEAGYLLKEFGMDFGEHREINCDVATANNLIYMCFEIESEEICISGDNELSKRGELATGLINKIHGTYGSTECDQEEGAECDEQAVSA